jgi:hypothetical protein
MPQNLVEGGARRGWFQTRHSRLVHLTEPFDYSEPPQPGREPETRICWRGELMLGDGHTVDSNGIWEQSGAFKVQNGVLQRNDLVILVRLDPEPESDYPLTEIPQIEGPRKKKRKQQAAAEPEQAELETEEV